MKGQRAPFVRSTFSPDRIRERTAGVASAHRDPETPERPLYVLIPAGIAALGAFAAMIFICVQTWYLRDVTRSTGVLALVVSGVAFIGAIFAFNYAWEQYDARKAVRRTIVMCSIAFAAVAVVAAVLAILSSDSDVDIEMPKLRSSDAAQSAAAGGTAQRPSRDGWWQGGGGGSWTPGGSGPTIGVGDEGERGPDASPDGETDPYQTQREREALRRKGGGQPGALDGEVPS
jgi:hypothetical protein